MRVSVRSSGCVLAALAVVLSPLLMPAAAGAQKAVILVRHAEKLDASEDPPLSKPGEARAARLASLLREAGVTALYATQYQRTVKTLEPLAGLLGLEVQVVGSDESQAQVDRLRAEHAGDVVVLAGHSGSVPRLLRIYGHAEEVTIAEDDYSNLFILVPGRDGAAPAVVRLRY